MDEFYKDMPLLHVYFDKESQPYMAAGGFAEFHLRLMYKYIEEHIGFSKPLNFLETGAGLSTLFFLATGANRITSIAPDLGLFSRIEKAAKQREIDVSPLRKIAGLSQFHLPKIVEETENGDLYDVGLIDGDHGWPMVFVDFCYINYTLRKGGILIIDDSNIHPVRELVNFLEQEKGFERLYETDHGKMCIFKKVTSNRFTANEGRPYLIEKTKELKQRLPHARIPELIEA